MNNSVSSVDPAWGTVGAARAVAAAWVRDHARSLPGYAGAYVTGSAAGRPDGAALPATSDLDVKVVTDAPGGPGKFRHGGVLLDVSHVPLPAPAAALASYHLAPSLRAGAILDDPRGELRALHAAVAAGFAATRGLRRDDALATIERHLAGAAADRPWAVRVQAWLFGTGVTAHAALAAAGRNPTIRTRYAAAREVLTAPEYAALLRLLDGGDPGADRVRAHLAALAPVFDATAEALRAGPPAAPLPFLADLTAAARPVAIDGSRELVDAGLHREAMFWIAVTFARCAQAGGGAAGPALAACLADLGIRSAGDLAARVAAVRAFLPRLRAITDDILKTSC
ncbi:hypothetical protein [Spirilliplanes yamanashiensis]|uniref:Nucleotidyltransferase domain-containing protein n=1 Tax=Spirilliplanes yamanashiensis TaxID=42233 RepID=A0A8J4DJU3_9ACTN|nr:hypothetical protein [Spirilliplanes yamanashiensis]GIJ03674.1 hypothetical protein Sya03_30260 [Spirilliplanes yamanashiensis]